MSEDELVEFLSNNLSIETNELRGSYGEADSVEVVIRLKDRIISSDSFDRG